MQTAVQWHDQCDQHRWTGHIEGSFRCTLAGRHYDYLASYEKDNVFVEWYATVQEGDRFSCLRGTLSPDQRNDGALEETLRAHVLAGIERLQVRDNATT